MKTIEVLKYLKNKINDESLISDYDKEVIINILSKYDLVNKKEVQK